MKNELVELAKSVHYFSFHTVNREVGNGWYIELCLLQKYLMDEHDMYVLPIFDGILFDVSIYGRYTTGEIKITSFLSHEPTFYTYEQALEFGLIEALKLIKDDTN